MNVQELWDELKITASDTRKILADEEEQGYWTERRALLQCLRNDRVLLSAATRLIGLLGAGDAP